VTTPVVGVTTPVEGVQSNIIKTGGESPAGGTPDSGATPDAGTATDPTVLAFNAQYGTNYTTLDQVKADPNYQVWLNGTDTGTSNNTQFQWTDDEGVTWLMTYDNKGELISKSQVGQNVKATNPLPAGQPATVVRNGVNYGWDNIDGGYTVPLGDAQAADTGTGAFIPGKTDTVTKYPKFQAGDTIDISYFTEDPDNPGNFIDKFGTPYKYNPTTGGFTNVLTSEEYDQYGSKAGTTTPTTTTTTTSGTIDPQYIISRTPDGYGGEIITYWDPITKSVQQITVGGAEGKAAAEKEQRELTKRTAEANLLAQQKQTELAEQRFLWDKEQAEKQLAAEKEKYAAELRAKPVNWLQYAAYTGETPVIQPWMKPLMSQQYKDFGIGQAIPGWSNSSGGVQKMGTNTIGTNDMLAETDLPDLLNPSAQYMARLAPSMRQQYYGYQQADTGATPEDTQWWLGNMAPPGGQNTGLRYS
jgi:hypothetical protein